MTVTERWKQLPTQEFVALGVQNLAYIKPVTVNDHLAFAIHAADGTPMAVLDDRLVAEAAIRQHDLEPLSVH
ncbi:MAG TPA: DUF1150 family protein [Stellaceae bacterium]|nr:DUF1150 family protein [Stellaceae bacterium]